MYNMIIITKKKTITLFYFNFIRVDNTLLIEGHQLNGVKLKILHQQSEVCRKPR